MEESRDARVSFLLDSFLGDRKDDADLTDLNAAPSDYATSYLEGAADLPESEGDKAIRSRAEDLLNAFLSTGCESIKLDLNVAADVPECDVDEKDDALDDSCYTETLARIYLKQHRYDKALEIIKSLYLNFPNKSIYFADQIRYLEILVKINQKK
jgi:tetratricopeptide (TPR) repeat protein